MIFSKSGTCKSNPTKTYSQFVLIGLLTILILSILILAYVPPVSRDALTHHLAVPKLYLKEGGIYEIPTLKSSYYPMNLDLLYLIPLYFGNDIVPKFIHFAFALLTGFLVFSYLKKRLNILYALLGVLLFLSLPAIVKLSITAYVDLGLMFFSTAALIFFLKWIKYNFRLQYLLISAVWCGLAMGTKYNGLIVFMLLTLFVVFIYSRSSAAKTARQSKALGFGAAFLVSALMVFSPWAIRNYIWTNNPIYPLYNSWFNINEVAASGDTEAVSVNNSADDDNVLLKTPEGSWSHFWIRKVVFNERWWEIALIPIRIFFQGQDDDPKYFDGKLNPLLFFLPFFAFLQIKRDSWELQTEKKILIAFSILFILISFFQRDMRIRYIGPSIPPLVILSILGLYNTIKFLKEKHRLTLAKIGTGFVIAGMCFCMSLNAIYIYDQFRYVDPISYSSGRVDRDEYISKYRSEYAAIKFANQNIPAHAKILGVFIGNRRYYSDREMLFAYNKYIRNPIQGQFSSERMLADIQNNGITHILIRYDLFDNWVRVNFDKTEVQRLKQFFEKYAVLIFSKSGHGLFQIDFTAKYSSK